MACVGSYTEHYDKTKKEAVHDKAAQSAEPNLQESVWFYDAVSINTQAHGVLKMSPAEAWFVFVAPQIPELWTHMAHPTYPMTYSTYCNIFADALRTAFKANGERAKEYEAGNEGATYPTY